jgi:hypothetical protein
MTAVSVSKHCGKSLNQLCSWHHCIRIVMQNPNATQQCISRCHVLLLHWTIHTSPTDKIAGLEVWWSGWTVLWTIMTKPTPHIFSSELKWRSVPSCSKYNIISKGAFSNMSSNSFCRNWTNMHSSGVSESWGPDDVITNKAQSLKTLREAPFCKKPISVK